MSDGIKEGDVVQFKSGGSKMTVDKIEESLVDRSFKDVSCCWFKEGEVKTSKVRISSLKKVTEEK